MPFPVSWDLLMVLAECHNGLQLSGMLLERNVYPAEFCLVPYPLLQSWLGELEAKTPQWTWRLAPSDIRKSVFLGHQTWLEIFDLCSGKLVTASERLYSCFHCSGCSELPSLCLGPARKLKLLCCGLAHEYPRRMGAREGETLMGGRARRQREFFSKKGFLVDLKISFRRNLVSCSSVGGWDTSQGDPWAVPDSQHKSAAVGAVLCSHPGLLEPGAEPQAGRLHNVTPNLPAEGFDLER